MALTLQIENYDRLEDGGPAQYSADQAGFQVGRGSMMDWVLPDPMKHISTHHFDVSFSDGAYWLTDLSTNGTFLQGSSHRLDAPHRLAEGDRFQVGHYIIVTRLGEAATADVPTAAPASDAADPWALPPASVEPINPMPRPANRAPDEFPDSFIATPQPGATPPPVAMPTPPVVAPAPPEAAPQPPAAVPVEPAAAAPAGVPEADIVAAFCRGAGLDPGAFGDADATALAEGLGQAMRRTVQDLMALLQDRASAKQFTKGGERTMLGAEHNNPLKFLPDSVEALEALFLKPRPGYMAGAEGLGDALRDIRIHQTAVFAAIQPALAQLLSDLAPEAIEAEAQGGVLGGGRKGKAWELFVQRWDAKAGAHENGMLDVFLDHFAEAYAKASSGQG